MLLCIDKKIKKIIIVPKIYRIKFLSFDIFVPGTLEYKLTLVQHIVLINLKIHILAK